MEMQKDADITQMIAYITGAAARPSKQVSMLLSPLWHSFFRHFRLFCASPQGVLLRQWTTPTGEVRWLLVISDEMLQSLIKKAHEFTPALLQPPVRGRKRKEVGERESRVVHSGINRTLTTIGCHYYHHSAQIHQQLHPSVSHLRPHKSSQGEERLTWLADTDVSRDFVGGRLLWPVEHTE